MEKEDLRQGQEVEQKSEFLKKVNDFVEEMNAQVAEDKGNRALIILAKDEKDYGCDNPQNFAALLGIEMNLTLAIAEAMREQMPRKCFDLAKKIVGGVEFDDKYEKLNEHADRLAKYYETLDDGLRILRKRHLSTLYLLLIMATLWTLALAGMKVMELLSWSMLISNLFATGVAVVLCLQGISYARREERNG